MKLRRGIAVLVPVLGIAAVGAVGAQMLQYSEYDPPAPTQAEPITEPLPASDVRATEAIVPATEAPAPEPIIVAPAPAPAPRYVPVPVERVVIDLPRSVSPRSGEGSGEEIATRTAPVDERAGSSPLYQVDQSPGL